MNAYRSLDQSGPRFRFIPRGRADIELNRRSARLITTRAFRGFILWALTTSLFSEGFRNPPPGAFGLGRAGGRITQVDDSSASIHNPANLMDLKRPEAIFAPNAVYIHVDYDSPAGGTAETTDPFKLLPNFFAGLPLKGDRFAAGLAVTTPYGISNEWKQEGAFADPTALRYQTPYFGELMTIRATPVFAARLFDGITLGAGIDVMWSQLRFKQFYPWAVFPGSNGTEPDGDARAKGDGVGVGASLGVTWAINERHRLAATFKSPIHINYSGDFKINNITPAGSAFGVTPASPFDTDVTFPTIVALGYGVRVTDRVRLEINGEWLQFSNFDELSLGLGNNALLFPSTTIPQDWKDTFTIGAAGDWQFAPNWMLRFGYQYYMSPVPDSTFSPLIPDADQNVITAGIAYDWNRHHFEFAYAYDFYDRRNITDNINPAFNGTYKVDVHLFALNYRFTF